MGPTVVIAAQVVTLSSTIGAVKPPAVAAGKTISFTLTLQNTGNVDSTGLANLSIGFIPRRNHTANPANHIRQTHDRQSRWSTAANPPAAKSAGGPTAGNLQPLRRFHSGRKQRHCNRLLTLYGYDIAVSGAYKRDGNF